MHGVPSGSSPLKNLPAIPPLAPTLQTLIPWRSSGKAETSRRGQRRCTQSSASGCPAKTPSFRLHSPVPCLPVEMAFRRAVPRLRCQFGDSASPKRPALPGPACPLQQSVEKHIQPIPAVSPPFLLANRLPDRPTLISTSFTDSRSSVPVTYTCIYPVISVCYFVSFDAYVIKIKTSHFPNPNSSFLGEKGSTVKRDFFHFPAEI